MEPTDARQADVPEFARVARRHLTLVVGRTQLLRRAAQRGTVDLDECVGRLDDIELSVKRLAALVADLEQSAEPGRSDSRSAPPMAS